MSAEQCVRNDSLLAGLTPFKVSSWWLNASTKQMFLSGVNRAGLWLGVSKVFIYPQFIAHHSALQMEGFFYVGSISLIWAAVSLSVFIKIALWWLWLFVRWIKHPTILIKMTHLTFVLLWHNFGDKPGIYAYEWVGLMLLYFQTNTYLMYSHCCLMLNEAREWLSLEEDYKVLPWWETGSRVCCTVLSLL